MRAEFRAKQEKERQRTVLRGERAKHIDRDLLDTQEQQYVDAYGMNFRETKKISYPNNQGVSGAVFNKHKPIYANEMKTINTYVADIDNLTSVKEVRNFLIAPVFGHDNDIRGDNSPIKFDRKHPIGIIQLINKLNYQKITDFDVQKVQAMESLIGLAIE